MTTGFKVSTAKWAGVTKSVEGDIAKASTRTMDVVTVGLKGELRDQVLKAGMGTKLANTWRGRRYPVSGESIAPAAFVFSKAPEIIDAFDRGVAIRPVNGQRYLAIPTENVPRATAGPGVRGGTHRMTPAEVETYFNQDLKFLTAKNGRLIAYIDAVGGFAPTILGQPMPTFRRATPKQLGRYYRTGKAFKRAVRVAMFILTPTAKLPKRFDVDAAARHWVGQVEPIFTRNLSALS